jgi:5-methylcytosine-specific restriction endonuclease McrA
MGRVKCVGPRVQVAKQAPGAVLPTTQAIRMTGGKLQKRRLLLWSRSPCCAACGRLTDYPHGFEIDHIVPLHQGGRDDESNLQVLCSGPDGCHAAKTKREAPRR